MRTLVLRSQRATCWSNCCGDRRINVLFCGGLGLLLISNDANTCVPIMDVSFAQVSPTSSDASVGSGCLEP